ncbi:hypothetical protein M5K25_007158 [Dendrobium thyrsiflorum]|uniref:Uncharacterized protein n=1 Tax=Dendrobium thyrsiflorum TaxID=117978 RepID=A0ABD0VKS9_DENTH
MKYYLGLKSLLEAISRWRKALVQEREEAVGMSHAELGQAQEGKRANEPHAQWSVWGWSRKDPWGVHARNTRARVTGRLCQRSKSGRMLVASKKETERRSAQQAGVGSESDGLLVRSRRLERARVSGEDKHCTRQEMQITGGTATSTGARGLEPVGAGAGVVDQNAQWRLSVSEIRLGSTNFLVELVQGVSRIAVSADSCEQVKWFYKGTTLVPIPIYRKPHVRKNLRLLRSDPPSRAQSRSHPTFIVRSDPQPQLALPRILTHASAPVVVPPVIHMPVPCASPAPARHARAPTINTLRLARIPRAPVRTPTDDFTQATRLISSPELASCTLLRAADSRVISSEMHWTLTSSVRQFQLLQTAAGLQHATLPPFFKTLLSLLVKKLSSLEAFVYPVPASNQMKSDAYGLDRVVGLGFVQSIGLGSADWVASTRENREGKARAGFEREDQRKGVGVLAVCCGETSVQEERGVFGLLRARKERNREKTRSRKRGGLAWGAREFTNLMDRSSQPNSWAGPCITTGLAWACDRLVQEAEISASVTHEPVPCGPIKDHISALSCTTFPQFGIWGFQVKPCRSDALRGLTPATVSENQLELSRVLDQDISWSGRRRNGREI